MEQTINSNTDGSINMAEYKKLVTAMNSEWTKLVGSYENIPVGHQVRYLYKQQPISYSIFYEEVPESITKFCNGGWLTRNDLNELRIKGYSKKKKLDKFMVPKESIVELWYKNDKPKPRAKKSTK
jgi:hypothetical protein